MKVPVLILNAMIFLVFLIFFGFLGTWESQHQCGINKVKEITANMKYMRITLHTECRAYSKLETSL